jgi:hypothetical protein
VRLRNPSTPPKLSFPKIYQRWLGEDQETELNPQDQLSLSQEDQQLVRPQEDKLSLQLEQHP